MLSYPLLSLIPIPVFGNFMLLQLDIAPLWLIAAVLGFIFLNVVSFVIYYLANSRINRRKEFDHEARRSEFQRFAGSQGWKLEPSPRNPAILENVRFYDGFNPQTLNMISGTYNGLQVAVFDLRSKRRREGARIDYFYTVFAVHSKELSLPVFYLLSARNRNFIIEESFDIDFPHRPHFSNKYLLFSHSPSNAGSFVKNLFRGTGQNDFRVRRLFDDMIISFFENDPSDLNAAGGGEYLFIYSCSCDRAEFVAGADFGKHLDYLRSVFNLFRNAGRRLNRQ